MCTLTVPQMCILSTSSMGRKFLSLDRLVEVSHMDGRVKTLIGVSGLLSFCLFFVLSLTDSKTTTANVHSFSSFDGNCFRGSDQFLKGFTVGGKH